MLWTVFAWARRQFESFLDPAPTAPPMAATLTSATTAPVAATTLAAAAPATARTFAAAETSAPLAAPAQAVSTVSTPYLPFDMPIGPTDKKVFAHYVSWIPISLDNLPAEQDYYTTQLLNPLGEGGVHAAYGGLLRDRPLPRDPINDPNWRQIDLLTEIDQAKSVGIDGFALDIIHPRSVSDSADQMMRAAETTDDFSILVTADMAGSLGDLSEEDFAAEFAPYLTSPAAYRLNDGRVVLGAFYAERQPAGWWSNTLTDFHDTYGLDVAFVPTFLDAPSNMDEFAPFSYGFSNWGGRNAVVTNPDSTFPGLPLDLANRSHELGKIWMQPVAFQDNRPREGIYEESGNTLTNLNSWQAAMNGDAEWVQLITWNDYVENTAMAPSVEHGWRMLDMQAYSVAQYKYGTAPTVVRDAIYVSHRDQFAASESTYEETLEMELRPGTPSAIDTVDVVVFATEPAVIYAFIGGNQVGSCGVGGGRGKCSFPLAGTGDVVIGMWRDNQWVTVVQSPYTVTDMPYVQDLEYHISGGLR